MPKSKTTKPEVNKDSVEGAVSLEDLKARFEAADADTNLSEILTDISAYVGTPDITAEDKESAVALFDEVDAERGDRAVKADLAARAAKAVESAKDNTVAKIEAEVANTPAATPVEDKAVAEQKYEKLFADWLMGGETLVKAKHGDDALAEFIGRQDYANNPQAALDGGAVLPTRVGELSNFLPDYSGVYADAGKRSYPNARTVSRPKWSGDTGVNWREADSGGSNQATVESVNADNVAVPIGRVSTAPIDLTEEMLGQSDAYSVVDAVASRLGSSLAKGIGAGLISGAGGSTGAPLGILTALKAGGGVSSRVNTASSSVYTVPELLQLRVIDRAFGKGKLYISSANLAVLRNLSQGTASNRPLFTNPQTGEESFYGHDIVIDENLEAAGAGKYPMFFGNLAMSYFIAEVQGSIRINRSQPTIRHASQGVYSFVASHNLGGAVMLIEGIKGLALKA